MSTRGEILDLCQEILGDPSTEFRTLLEGVLNKHLYTFFDLHDWNFKHKVGTFSSVAGTETYDLSVAAPTLRSNQDLEILYETTNGRKIDKIDFKKIKALYPKEDQSGEPTLYAPWGGNTTIYMSPKPDAIYTYKFGFLARPILPVADATDLEVDCEIPAYTHPAIEQWVLLMGMQITDDDRRPNALQEFFKVWLPKAIQADMLNLENDARWRFAGDNDRSALETHTDYINSMFWGND